MVSGRKAGCLPGARPSRGRYCRRLRRGNNGAAGFTRWLGRLTSEPNVDNQIETRTSDPMQQNTSETRPYAPSFLDRFMDFVQRLPSPYWLTYFVLFILQSIIAHTLAWIVGWLPAYTFSPILLIFPVWLWGPLAMMTHLNLVSLEALSSFSPLLDVEEERLNMLKYEFTIMPARSVVLSGVIWSIFYLILTYLAIKAFYVAYGLGIFLSGVVVFEGLISFGIGSALYYHSLRQLRLVNLTVKMVKQFNLFRLDPVYAFSRLTSQIGVSWMIMLSLTLLLLPMQLANVPVLVILVLQVVLAVAAFILPLWFVNRRLVSEKRRLLAELNRRVESTLERLHRYLDENDMGEVDQLNRAMTGLNAERGLLTSIPTWPWSAGVLTGFLSTIALPIIIFLIQLVVKNWLSR